MRDDLVLVDTDVFSRVIMTPRNARPEDASLRRMITGRAVAISVQTKAEVQFGALVKDWGQKKLAQLDASLAAVALAPVNDDVTEAWARLRALCRRQGRQLAEKIHMGDCWIAATAIAYEIPLASGDGIFVDAPGLTLLRPDE
ncbi:PIN domain-containing protein [Enemella evansiae]|uniref:PIN domain-containing protein n=1 Tax=Enemella evansiae TaxID=2016499 RepID=UPI000B973589|nr:PIN domain-containing protein [Enemella evansiae]OYO19758.1 PIN domain nuclease [Enemella evansiae]TDO91632.1 hypothetical protein C8D81_1942 [Enemella evansiae]